jgi:hypothetical protein
MNEELSLVSSAPMDRSSKQSVVEYELAEYSTELSAG